jgi:3-carboxy-cis,cis-muconate cycloisomerase
MAEHVMVGIADKVGRVQAHDIIYEDCKRCIETGKPLADLLKVNPNVTKYLTPEEIAWRMEPRNYLGSCLAWVDTVVKDR